MSHAYWVVGAMFGGTDDQLPKFLRGGYWICGKPTDTEKEQLSQFKPDDRIAVKRMLGTASRNIEIRALGILMSKAKIEPDSAFGRVEVHWVLDRLKREVPSKGCFATIHGPFDPDKDWTKTVFQL